MTTCPSVNVLRSPYDPQAVGELTHLPCTRDAGHWGDCKSADGHRWIRLREILRQRGQILDGTHVRNLFPCGHSARWPGCGGCDPGAVELVILDDGTRRPYDPAVDMVQP